MKRFSRRKWDSAVWESKKGIEDMISELDNLEKEVRVSKLAMSDKDRYVKGIKERRKVLRTSLRNLDTRISMAEDILTLIGV